MFDLLKCRIEACESGMFVEVPSVLMCFFSNASGVPDSEHASDYLYVQDGRTVEILGIILRCHE